MFALVCSLFGVILIARPASIFGPASLEELEYELDELPADVTIVTPAQRVTAVGYVVSIQMLERMRS